MKNCFTSTDILLPAFAQDAEKMTKWACIACDQYTSEPDYWLDVEKIVGDAPSALNLVLPELYLDEADSRIGKINAAMGEYLDGTLVTHRDAMIYLERRLKSGKVRRGLVGAVDLECYDYTKGASSLIRATEGTVLERIPPRVKIREGAPVELPHIMILIDDPDRTVIEPLIDKAAGFTAAYDFDFMKNGGHVVGRFVPADEQARISDALDQLCELDAYNRRYGLNETSPMLFAMGDGNHSLASAKAFWEQVKSTLTPEEASVHPARWALCEIVNIHDEALEFEPIYRVAFGVEPEKLVSELREYAASLPASDVEAQTIELVMGDKTETVIFENPTSFLPVGTLQTFLDAYIKRTPGAKIDYIHGVESTKTLASGESCVGFLFRGMEKGDLFKTVICDGALPRKTFSMGEADDKRFYLEARKIR
ncbi:MAG: DUF1015 domain-containing protein [Clostridia bacterium]|nr:DUF1015 domain-containing protein [Clostridia bacterium]